MDSTTLLIILILVLLVFGAAGTGATLVLVRDGLEPKT